VVYFFSALAAPSTGRVVLWSRYATDYSDTFVRIAEAVRALPVDNALIDGEAVVFRPDGHSDFTALRSNRGAAQASPSPTTFCNLKARTGASSRSRSGARSWSPSSPG
jgi:ATP-dependent DNA ligase